MKVDRLDVYRLLGKSGLRVSPLCLGTMTFGTEWGWGANEQVSKLILDRYAESGGNFIDTANAYSTSEERIGKAIAGRREQVIIATKSAARDRAAAQKHLELSLKRLNVETIDLWQLHNVSSDEALEQVLGPGGAMEAAQWALDRGMIRHIGITQS